MKRNKKNHKKNKNHHHDPHSGGNNKLDDGEAKEEQHNTLYKIKHSDVLGRYLVAARNLASGAVLVSEQPLVIGPCQEATPLCLGCYNNINLGDTGSFVRCKGCNWPLCSASCVGIYLQHGHSRTECQLLASFKTPDAIPVCWYYAVTPLRCLALQSSDLDSWSVIRDMESHDEARKAVPELWKTNQEFVVARIRSTWGLVQFSEEEIHKVCGVLEINCFEVRSSSAQSLRALYPTAFLFAHDCVPNTTHSDGDGYRLVVRTSIPVPAGTTLSVSYAYTLQPTLKRRKHLQSSKFFSCKCRRCSDPTELGTHIGSLLCPLCKGSVLSVTPLDDNAEWRCKVCKQHTTPAQTVLSLINSLSIELDGINGNDIPAYERFLADNAPILHENNYLQVSALHSLSQLYGKINGYLINDLKDHQLERKIEICKQLLDIFSTLEPGQSKQRGLLLYEIQAPMMVLMQRKFQKQQISRKELKTKLKDICKYLEESSRILEFEDPKTNEGGVALAAKEALLSLTNWKEVIEHI